MIFFKNAKCPEPSDFSNPDDYHDALDAYAGEQEQDIEPEPVPDIEEQLLNYGQEG